ncbi:hypothetical protein BDV18DRAFT_142279 [Aspergillus unguis]
MPDQKHNEAPPPPPPPEDPTSKISPFVQKLRSAPPEYYFQPEIPPILTDLFAPPTGPYFFYGTLSDPGMLRDILDLDSKPKLRPASIVGYECKLWGQYPALVDAPYKTVHGYVYHVETQEQAQSLAEYETENYRAEPCRIMYTDVQDAPEVFGYTFKFVSNARYLTEGSFDLGVWLRRMKRTADGEDA